MKNRNYIILLSIIFFVNCKKEKNRYDFIRDKYDEALSKLEIKCDKIEDKYFFKGLVNGDSLCIANGYNNYIVLGSYLNLWTTTSGTFTVGDTSNNKKSKIALFSDIKTSTIKEFIPQITIESPYEFSNQFRPIQMAEKYLRKGVFNIRSKESKENEDFSVTLRLPYIQDESREYPNNFQYFSFSSENGSQKNSEFEILDVVKEISRDSTHYSIKVKINCALFINQYKISTESYFGSITNGIFSTLISVPNR